MGVIIYNSLDWNEILKRLFFLYKVDTQDDLGEKLDVSQDLISKWKRGITRPTWDLIGKVVKDKDVTWDYLLEGRENTDPPPPRVDGEFDIDRIDIVFSLQRSLADFQVILSESGRDLAVGQSLKGYNDIPGLLTTVRKLKDLCESVSKRLESYPQHEKDHGHSDQDRTA